MNKLNYVLLTVFLTTLAVHLNAQQFFFSAERPAACAAVDGILTIVPIRGVPPFTYLWSTGATEVSIKNVPKGTYSATLTDATGATVVHTHFLNSEEFDLNLAHAQPSSLCDANSGALTVNPVGGVAPYSYVWSNGQTSATIQGLSAGTYSLTVQDATGCVALGEYDVEALMFNYFPSAQISPSNYPDCANPTAGELSGAMIYSNYPPFTYNWSNGATTQTISNLNEGSYLVTITDALGCTSIASYDLKPALTLTGSVVCNGSTSGTASALLVNATAPVSYFWSNGQVSQNLSNLSNGQYAVTATDANGCVSSGAVDVVIPILQINDNSPKCYAGNMGAAYCWVQYDNAVSYLWDNGHNDAWAQSLSPGLHSVTVTTDLGCVLSGNVDVLPPLAPPFVISTAVTPGDCLNGVGGALNLTVSGGIPPYSFYAYGPDGFFTSDPGSMQNIQSGSYFLAVYTSNLYQCATNATIIVPDVSGFEPSLVVNQVDCNTGYGSAAILGVTTPGAQYEWSNGAATQALFNLTEGIYSVTVSAGALCNRFYEFYMYSDHDSLQMTGCSAIATGQLINDLGVIGCVGTQGIPYQLIRTLPSGALNFTDDNGIFNLHLPNGVFDLEAAHYDPADIACPPTGQHHITTVVGTTQSGLDFHFLNNNAIDHRLRQQALRTAQPGYPYSVRLEVCNDGAASVPGTLDVEYANFLGATSGHHFPQHPGAFTLNSESSGIPNNDAAFSFPAVTPGACELLQLDLLTPTSTPLNTAFVTDARVSPTSGDPTPDNNISTRFNTVMGSFDPNCVLAYPARNGNPKDGGQILRYEDNTIVYQIFFQNTGNAPADLVVVRDPLDDNLDLSTIRNITATHNMKIMTESDDQVLVFKFENINLPDSISDYAGSIGSIQYEIDLKPGLDLGTEIEKQVSIYFDFNAAVITNQNVLELVSSTTVPRVVAGNALVLFPNPTDAAVGFYCDTASNVSIYNSLGVLVATQQVGSGLQQLSTVDLPSGLYLVQLDANGVVRNGKVVVQH